ncbi:MAG: hypothetical protein QOK23_1907 [Gammaproteobacteria bacterium]|jgi:hypothetical protein|nr:hypothetical protein [Gammaproteobacteria bacterium]
MGLTPLSIRISQREIIGLPATLFGECATIDSDEQGRQTTRLVRSLTINSKCARRDFHSKGNRVGSLMVRVGLPVRACSM